MKTTLNDDSRLGIYYEYGASDDFITKKLEHLDALVGTNGPMACCHFVRVDGVVKRQALAADPWIVNCALTIENGVPDIVNHPCENPKNWDNPTLRTCGNAVYIYSDLK